MKEKKSRRFKRILNKVEKATLGHVGGREKKKFGCGGLMVNLGSGQSS